MSKGLWAVIVLCTISVDSYSTQKKVVVFKNQESPFYLVGAGKVAQLSDDWYVGVLCSSLHPVKQSDVVRKFDHHQAIALRMARAVSVRALLQHWREIVVIGNDKIALQQFASELEHLWQALRFEDLKQRTLLASDEVRFMLDPKLGTSVWLNGTKVATFRGHQLFLFLKNAWVGDQLLNTDFKQNLLGVGREATIDDAYDMYQRLAPSAARQQEVAAAYRPPASALEPPKQASHQVSRPQQPARPKQALRIVRETGRAEAPPSQPRPTQARLDTYDWRLQQARREAKQRAEARKRRLEQRELGNRYKSKLQTVISGAVKCEDRFQGFHFQALVRTVVKRDGELKDLTIIASSGNSLIDNYISSRIRKVSRRFASAPPELSGPEFGFHTGLQLDCREKMAGFD